jgi:NitT/TauT family transport system substrate-binding protein
MGDYPLVVNGFTFQSNPESRSQLVAVAAYNIYGSGNGLVVHKDSPYFELSDLKDKVVSVPFGSAAHGMVLKAMQDRGYASDFFQLVSQSPEVGSTNLQEKKIDAHADFVPFAELLPFRGFARKILTASRPICRPFTRRGAHRLCGKISGSCRRLSEGTTDAAQRLACQ